MVLLLAGVALGVLSRIEETEPFFAGISTHATWLLAPYLAGLLDRWPRRGAVRGAALLTAANAGYYAWSAATRPDLPLAAVAGPVEHWVAAGLAAGAFAGAAGALTRGARGPSRAAAPAAVVAVLVADAFGLFATLLP